MNKLLIRSALCSLALGGTLSASAVSVTYSFGPTSDTFGGTGIPNNAVATTTIGDIGGSKQIVLGLTAHQRYDNPPLINNGAGTFTATAGANAKPNGTGTVGAKWNFAWDIDLNGGAKASDYNFSLLYDFNPGVNTPTSQLGVLNLGSTLDDSQNLLFSFLDGNTGTGSLYALFGITDPPNGSFDPNANGEYTFALIASTTGGTELGRSTIRVNVTGGTSTAVPDGGATAIFLGLGFAGLFAYRKIQK